MNIEFVDKELDVYEDGQDCNSSGGIFNFCETLAGNTLTINTIEYDIKKEEDFDGVFILTKKQDEIKVK